MDYCDVGVGSDGEEVDDMGDFMEADLSDAHEHEHTALEALEEGENGNDLSAGEVAVLRRELRKAQEERDKELTDHLRESGGKGRAVSLPAYDAPLSPLFACSHLPPHRGGRDSGADGDGAAAREGRPRIRPPHPDRCHARFGCAHPRTR